MERSTLFAVDELNRAGGIDGRKLQLVIKDTAADADKAVKAARELIAAGVVAIIGPGTSSEAVAVIEQVTRAAPHADDLAGRDVAAADDAGGRRHLLSHHRSDAFQGRVLAQRIYDDGHRTLALIYREDPYGEGLRDTITSAFTGLGGQITQAVGYPENKIMNFGAEAARLLPEESEADAVALLSFHEDGANITRDIQALGLATLPSFYGVDAVYSSEFATAGAPARGGRLDRHRTGGGDRRPELHQDQAGVHRADGRGERLRRRQLRCRVHRGAGIHRRG
jgi:branched-chain amino acid transport system substrate-binding protein